MLLWEPYVQTLSAVSIAIITFCTIYIFIFIYIFIQQAH